MARNVFQALSRGGMFWNEEIRLEKWTSDSPRFNDWRQRTMEAARHLGIPLHSAQDIESSFREAGFQACKTWTRHLEASASTAQHLELLEAAKLTIKSSVRILVEGGLYESAEEAIRFVEDVVEQLKEVTCEAEVYVASKPGPG